MPDDSKRYRSTLNLPRTDFPMRARLPEREPERLKHWAEIGLEARRRAARAGRERFVLHDGPPYANGAIHIGHAVNKILKDIVVRSRTLDGLDAPYRPGWDCHGLPIELQIEKTLPPEKREGRRAFRAACRDFAAAQIERQRRDFIRLGVGGRWDDPYRTMDFRAEADTVRALGALLAAGFLYRGRKPVYWCADCGSALAEAEVEYEEHVSTAVDVRFDAADGRLAAAFGLEPQTPVAVAIWTTTPWTLAANEAVCLHPEFEYALARRGEQLLLVAAALREAFCARAGAEPEERPGVPGAKLAGLRLAHPFLERRVPLLAASHVTADEGTGCVHTAPAHGPEDFAVGQAHGLPADCPVGADGRFCDDAPDWLAGRPLDQATAAVAARLERDGTLLAQRDHPHSYPHCWRHHTPLFFRTAEQWFVRLDDGLRERALAAAAAVDWHPGWGGERMRGMLESRPDWCVSRQRAWGTPIPLFWRRDDGELHPDTPALLERVAERIEQGGIDAWFDLEPEELLGAEAADYVKSPDTLDVWFDSGSTHRTVLATDPALGGAPADLYLEGSDQHRGWFQSSLLTAAALDGRAPYRAVLTHGFVVDAAGRKMAKSRGNVVEPQRVVDRLGADVLRLWVAGADTSAELAVSDEILDRTAEAYRRIRNTARYLLGCLADFDPAQHAVAPDALPALDQWVLGAARQVDAAVRAAYRDYEFHRAVQRLHTFCAVELGSLYLDITKDRSYTLPAEHPARRSAQTAMHALAEALARWLAPLCPFTADEIYERIPGPRLASVHLEEWFDLEALQPAAPALGAADWARLLELREAVARVLENLRRDTDLGAPLNAELTLHAPAAGDRRLLEHFGDELHFLFITSAAAVADAPPPGAAVERLPGGGELHVLARASEHAKCDRCWHRHPSVGADAAHPRLCARCRGNLAARPETRLHV